MVVVVIGPAGSGKSTVGRALAQALGWAFVDGDDLHSPENIAHIRRGGTLSDEQRGPWLAALAAEITDAIARGASLVVACSALRRSHRAALRPHQFVNDDLRFVYLKVSPEELSRRLATRAGHFAPATLLTSQLATFEQPAADERDVVTVDAEQTVSDVVDEILPVTFRNTR